ncbi:MAG: serine/threonine protein kinase [Myxococcales bacterium]|nr:serine/threonine protein kinase [Myxococcales bacterium]
MVKPSDSPSLWNRVFGQSAPSSTDPREFQQERVALFVKSLLVLLSSFYVIDALGVTFRNGPRGVLEPGLIIHLVLVLGLFAAWLFVRQGERSLMMLSVTDVACTLGLCLMVVGLLATLPPSMNLPGPTLSVAFAVVARAAIVPSTGQKTLLVGIVASLLVTLGYWRRGPESQPEPAFVFLWTFAFAVASAVVSRVIYGLQRQVLEARQLGQYTLEDRLGEGGMGAVYRAHHAMLRRDTAVKLLHPERAGTENLMRFEREVRQTARLSHPNTVTIFDYGRTPDGTFYYAMELLDGADLAEVVEATGPMPAERVVHVLACVAGALAEAHGVGLIHRDIKPANIILCQQGGVPDVPKVVDFGLVKELEADGGVLQTKADSILGTPLYMSPESIRAPDSVDGRSDIYALGAVGYYLLAGQHVFSGSAIVEVCLKHLEAVPVPPSERLGMPVPSLLEQLVLDCLAKDREQRPQTAAELQERLRNVGVGAWSASDAHAWWTAHGELVRSSRAAAQPVSGSDRTLAVDHERRT